MQSFNKKEKKSVFIVMLNQLCSTVLKSGSVSSPPLMKRDISYEMCILGSSRELHEKTIPTRFASVLKTGLLINTDNSVEPSRVLKTLQ